ncbi:CotH kinase family protein, partial [Flavobacteriales bacterium]|nr:CotH kinase family protein [Flavobacteriales bacterium]MDC0204704.1 CotH kinase family protein [Flavobacteriales bacterium]
YIDSFEYALNGPNFADTSIGYSKYIDVNSFIDLYIINELSRNIDGYRLSTYMYKDRDDNGGKLIMGPFWDYNLAFGNSENCSGGITSGWEVSGNCAINNVFWFERLLEDDNYHEKLKSRWEYLRERSFHQDSLFSFIDSIALYLNDAQQRNFQQWPILGTYVWPNYYVGNTYQDELNFFKTWISDRLIWIDNNIVCNYNSLSYDTLISDFSLIWNGMQIKESGNYLFRTINSNGCDSVAHLNFIIIPPTLPKTLLKIFDVVGRESKPKPNVLLLYIYDDGTVEKRIVIE